MRERLVFLHVGCLFLQAASRTDDIRPRDADSTFFLRVQEERKKERKAQVFLLFLFPFVCCLPRLLRDQMGFISHTLSLSFSVASGQEKSHLRPIKISLSPPPN